MPVIRKMYGEMPMETVVHSTHVSFDEAGLADVEQEIYDALITVPGFVAAEQSEASEGESVEDESSEDEETEDDSEGEEESVPSKPARKRPIARK